MQLSTRKTMDRAFSGLGIISILMMAGALIVLLGPIFVRGGRAFLFRGTVEYRRMMLEQFGRGDREATRAELALADEARRPVYEAIAQFEAELGEMDWAGRREYADEFSEVKEGLRVLLGPPPGEGRGALPRTQYGQTRWERARVKLHDVLFATTYDYSDPTAMGVLVYSPRRDLFEGTSLVSMFSYVEQNADAMLRPRWTFYGRFLTDKSIDAHFFGGIGPAVLGTLYLTIGAMLVAGPMGILSALYLTEYAGRNWFVSVIRACINTLAGVPSIVFGLFGLAFFINTLHVSPSKSVLAGSLTLACLVLPTVIRASEEALRAVPPTYKEAALSLGASKWRTTFTVVLPSALPGVLTSIILSMGRAAGETAPIIFTAAVSLGAAPKIWQVFTRDTPALPWNIYNLATEHAAVDEIRHVQYGMVLTLIAIVLLLNVAAIVLRARITKKLRG